MFLDIKGDKNEPIVKEFLEASDVVILNLTQRLRHINSYAEIKAKEENKKLVDKTLLLLGKYNPRLSKYTCKNITRYLKEKQVFFIPFNNLFFEVASEGKMADYFIKFRKAGENNPNGQFVLAIKLFSEKIIKKIKEIQMKV